MNRSFARVSRLLPALVLLAGLTRPAHCTTPDGLVAQWHQSHTYNSLLALVQYRVQNPDRFDDGTFDLDLAIATGLCGAKGKHNVGCTYFFSIASRYPERLEELSKTHASLCGDPITSDDVAGVSGKADDIHSSSVSLSNLIPALPAPDATYRIENVGNGLVLDVAGSSQDNGGEVVQYRWLGGDNQKWRFEPLTDDDNGYYRIVAVHSGKCLDVSEVSPNDGAILHQWDYVGGDNQKWELVPYKGGFAIRAKHSGKVVDVPGATHSEGTVMQQYSEGGEKKNQLWKIVRL